MADPLVCSSIVLKSSKTGINSILHFPLIDFAILSIVLANSSKSLNLTR